jgi:outer membrane protein assembly factor BamB
MRTALLRMSFLAIFCLAAGTAAADDWPQYGGPNRDGVSAERGLLKEWPAEGPPLLWKKTDLGTGYSPVSVVGTRVYTLAYRGADEYVVALDRGTGKEVWAVSLGVARESQVMAFLRQRQPTIDGDRLYAFSTHGHLVCLEVDQGKELWRQRYLEDLRGRPNGFGWTDYPLIDGDKLICTVGGKETFHVALNKRTGEVLWKSPQPEKLLSSYSPMVVAEIGGRRQYVQNLSSGLVAIDAMDGKVLWRYTKASNGTANVATPFVRDDLIFATTGYGTGSALLRQVGKGPDLKVEEIYFTKSFQSFYGGLVTLGEHVYAGHGASFSTAQPACFHWKTGQIAWQQKGPGQGAVATIAADGHLYFRFADGLVVMAEATPEAFREKGRLAPLERTTLPVWSVPVIAEGRMFLRDQQNLFCYDLRAEAPRKVAPSANKPQASGDLRQPDAVFVPSPPDVVEKMLELAKVGKGDLVYDLGSGDGRIVIAAAKKHQARGIGIEMDAALVRQARAEVEKAGLQDRVTIREADLFAADFRDATIVTLYLLPHLNAKLLPKLLQLKPGTRIVAYAATIPGVEPDQVVRFRSPDGLQEHTLFLWVTPLR